MVYYYFGEGRALKEEVADALFTAGSVGDAKIAVYWDKDIWRDTDCTATITYGYVGGPGIVLDNADVAYGAVTMPVDVKRDYRFFKADARYRMATFNVPRAVLSSGASVWAAVRVFNEGGTEIATLGDITFQVLGSYVGDTAITASQYSYLIAKVGAIAAGAINPDALHSVLEGSEFITADLNETGDKVQISIDTDYRPYVVELSGASGTLSDGDYAKLCGPTSSYEAKILLGDEFYEAASETEDYDTYSLSTTSNSVTTVKTITICKIDETKGEWALTSEQVSLPSTAGKLNKILHVGTSGPSWVDNYSRKVDYYPASGTTATGYLRFVKCTQSEYDAITPDEETLYIVTD